MLSQSVKIDVPLENGKKWEKIYSKDDKIQSIIDDFKNENGYHIPKKYTMKWSHFNKPLNYNDKIETLLDPNPPTVILGLNLEEKGLDLPENYSDNTTIVGHPFNNPFRIYTFEKDKQYFKTIKYNKTDINSSEIYKYNPTSSYCNGNNHLYISGGEDENKNILNDFWDINLIDESIEKCPVDFPKKKNHSMIYINDKYVFIVGGNDKSTYYYNTEKKELNKWADLNENHIEPALIFDESNNTLYCFDNTDRGKNYKELIFEKSVLPNAPKWEILKPNIDSNIPSECLNQKFFGVTKIEDDDFIFLGGDMSSSNKNVNQKKNLQYNVSSNTLKSSNCMYKYVNLKEKTFKYFNKNYDYILPDFNEEEPEVVFYNKKKNHIKLIKYKENNNNDSQLRNKNKISDKYDFDMPPLDYNYRLISNDNNIDNNENGEESNKKIFIEPKEEIVKVNQNFEQAKPPIPKLQKNKIKNYDELENYDGKLLKSFIIIDNKSGVLKNNDLPLVNPKKNLIKSNLVSSGNFNKSNIKIENLGNSINVGISGIKNEQIKSLFNGN